MHAKREHNIDALRGVAAMCVVAEHAFVSMRPPSVGMFSGPIEFQEILQWLTHVAFNGRAAVLLFFVISGYAMKLQWDTQPGDLVPKYLAFLTRRAFRILPAMWVSICLAGLIWCALGLPADLSIKAFYQAFTAQSAALNSPLWSIIVEIHCSIALPFLLLLHKRVSSVGHGAILLALFVNLIERGPVSLGYLVFFYCGVLIHDYGPLAVAILGRWVALVSVVSVLAYGLVPQLWVFTNSLLLRDGNLNYVILELIPCTIILIMVASKLFGPVNRLLSTRPALFIGSISYSIYLLNWPICQAFWTIFFQSSAPFWHLYYLVQVTFFLAIATINIVAGWALYRLVERPFNLMGRRVAELVETAATLWICPAQPEGPHLQHRREQIGIPPLSVFARRRAE